MQQHFVVEVRATLYSSGSRNSEGLGVTILSDSGFATYWYRVVRDLPTSRARAKAEKVEKAHKLSWVGKARPWLQILHIVGHSVQVTTPDKFLDGMYTGKSVQPII